MNLLVGGGAGFIESHMVKLLLSSQHNVLVFDNLSSGHRSSLMGGDLVEGYLSFL